MGIDRDVMTLDQVLAAAVVGFPVGFGLGATAMDEGHGVLG